MILLPSFLLFKKLILNLKSVNLSSLVPDAETVSFHRFEPFKYSVSLFRFQDPSVRCRSVATCLRVKYRAYVKHLQTRCYVWFFLAQMMVNWLKKCFCIPNVKSCFFELFLCGLADGSKGMSKECQRKVKGKSKESQRKG